MAKFAYFSTGMIRDAKTEFEVHAAGCAHLAKGDRKNFADKTLVVAESAEALVAEEVAEFEANDQGWSADDFRVFPCAKAV